MSRSGAKGRATAQSQLALLVLACTLISSCAAPPSRSSRIESGQIFLEHGQQVLIMEPIVFVTALEDSVTEQALSYDTTSLVSTIGRKVESELSRKGLRVATLSRPSVDAAALGATVFKRELSAAAKAETTDVASDHDASYLLFTRTEFFVGSGGSWNPISGAMTSRMQRTLLRGRLLRAADHQILWKGEVHSREQVLSDEVVLREIVEQLLLGIRRKEITK